MITSTHRGHGHVLAKGADPARMLAELMGRETGLNKGRGGSMHAADFGLGILGANAIVGAAGSIATGAAWAQRRRARTRSPSRFFGDGAVNEGMLLEAFNLAALWQVPVVFVCENNGYATTMPVDVGGRGQHHRPGRGVRHPGLHRRRAGPGEGAGGNHVPRSAGPGPGKGPTFLECMTYRFDAHHTFEHRARLTYRSAEEIATGRSRDPVEIQGARLPAADRAAVDAEVEALLDAAAGFALGSAHPDPAAALEYLYASPGGGR